MNRHDMDGHRPAAACSRDGVRRHARCVRVAVVAVGPGRAYRQDYARLQRVAGLVPLAGCAGAGSVRQEQRRGRAEVLRQLHRQPQRSGHRHVDANSQTLNDTLASVSGGAKQTIVLVNDNSTGNDQIIAAEGITRVADLKGKKVAVEQGTVDHYLLLLALQQAGLTEKDIKLEPLPTDARGGRVRRGPGRRGRRLRAVHHDGAGASGQPGGRDLGQDSPAPFRITWSSRPLGQGPPDGGPGHGEHLVRHPRLDQGQQGRGDRDHGQAGWGEHSGLPDLRRGNDDLHPASRTSRPSQPAPRPSTWTTRPNQIADFLVEHRSWPRSGPRWTDYSRPASSRRCPREARAVGSVKRRSSRPTARYATPAAALRAQGWPPLPRRRRVLGRPRCWRSARPSRPRHGGR